MTRIEFPRKAMVLAAGHGTRMQALGQHVAKAVMPLWNRSLLARKIDLLASWGVEDVLVNAHHLADQVMTEIVRYQRPGVRITCSFEPRLLDTGGALPHAHWFFDAQPFWLINADIVAELDPTPLLHRMRDPNVLAALWVTDQQGPRSVECRAGCVTSFRSRHPGTPGTVTFCGLQVVRPSLLRYLPDDGPVSIITAYDRARQAGWRIAAEPVPDSVWADVGTPERYLYAHQQTADRYAPTRRAPSVGCVSPCASVAATARVQSSVVWAGAEIQDHAVVHHAVVGAQVEVRGTCVGGLVASAEWACTPAEQDVLVARGWPLRQTCVHTLPPRGSNRSFSRLCAPRKTALLIRNAADGVRPENEYYTALGHFLHQCGWPVPRVLHAAPDRTWSLWEDAGLASLQEHVRSHPRAVWPRYHRLLEWLSILQTHITRKAAGAAPALRPPFGPDDYAYERELFIGYYLRGTCGVSKRLAHEAEAELHTMEDSLASSPQALMHRDFQSSNVLLDSSGAMRIIDFQGMRQGPCMYDVASLLCDPYVALPRGMRDRLLDDYMACQPHEKALRAAYPAACVQRLCQALGAFARLSALPGCQSFNTYIPAARNLLVEALDSFPQRSRVQSIMTWIAKGDGAKARRRGV